MVNKTGVLLFCILAINSVFIGQKKNFISDNMLSIETGYKESDAKKMLNHVHKIYQLDTILPDNAAFFLGYILYKSNKLRESKAALLRYVQLTKEIGIYFDSTQHIINKIDESLLQYDTNYCDICKTLGPLSEKEICKICDGNGKREQPCNACNATGIEICPRCLGVGYEHYQDSFQNNYYPCRVCNKSGTITCSNCNGTTKEVNVCKPCAGQGQVPKLRDCTHRNLKNAVITPQKQSNKSSFYR